MLKPKKKLTKQNLKEDKFVRYTLEAKIYLEENYNRILTMAAGIAAVIAIIIIFVYSSQQTEEEADAQLGIAQVEYANDNLTKATDRLTGLITEYDGTAAADQARFLLANIYFQQKRYADAGSYYTEFIENYSGSDILLASGYAGLAACREVDGDFAGAAELYLQASELVSDFPDGENYLFLSGLCFKKAGDYEQAREQFEYLVNISETTSRVQEAQTQLVLLKEAD